MDIEEYDGSIRTLRDEAIAAQSAPQDLLDLKLKQGDSKTEELIRLRELLIAGSEADSVSALLVSGYFKALPARHRIAALLISCEVSRAIEQTTLQKRLSTYLPTQKLFMLSPSLYKSARDGEMLEVRAVGEIGDDGLVQLKEGWARLDPMLPPGLVQGLMSEFPDAPLWIRLDPDFAYSDLQPSALMEAVLVPANPKWWKNLGLFRGEATGGKYVILPPEAAGEDIDSYVEYYVRGLRKLETIAQRKKVDHLTCMLEELQQVQEGMLVGRCIHLDTRAANGTSPDRASVMHLDLAINVYVDEKVEERLASALHGAEKVEASFRSHLLRIEEVPFAVLPAFCAAFFQSHVLLRDLIGNQFSAG